MRAGSIPATLQRRHAQGNGRKARSRCDRAFFIIRRFCSVVGSLALSLPSLRRPPKGGAGSTSAAAGTGAARPIPPKPEALPYILAASKCAQRIKTFLFCCVGKGPNKRGIIGPFPKQQNGGFAALAHAPDLLPSNEQLIYLLLYSAQADCQATCAIAVSLTGEIFRAPDGHN